MKKLVWLLMAFAFCSWATPKPMESIENYNVLMVHGAYGTDKGVSENGNIFLLMKIRYFGAMRLD